MKTQSDFLKKLPSAAKLSLNRKGCVVLVVDQKILSLPFVKKWTDSFQYVIPVQSGEALKSLERFEKITHVILNHVQGFAASEITLVGVGGGSVGDFVGFVASVLKRGVRLVHIPSTWLAAMDSAHGGKTALNIGDRKNQIGTYYPADKVYLVKELLFGQPSENLSSGLGEAFKMALLQGGDLFRKFQSAKIFDDTFLWSVLPALIQAKMKIVKSDPFEKRGKRFALNLGHTLGHAIELESKLPHGVAVQFGTIFALDFSHEKNLIVKKDYTKAKALLSRHLPSQFPVVSQASISRQIRYDKKSTEGGFIQFVFLKKIGRPIVQKVTVQQIVDSAKRLGWAR